MALPHALVVGFSLGFSLILAIGAQNAFVLRQGIRGEHVLAVVLTCAVSDAILITVGVGGFGALTNMAPGLETIMRWGGAAFLFVYGLIRFRAAVVGGERLDPSQDEKTALWPAILTCLGLTWLNPHVYLDTVMLLGSVSTRFAGHELAFGLGAVMASFVFFFALGFGARLLRPIFAQPVSWRVLDVIIGLVMWALSLRLILV